MKCYLVSRNPDVHFWAADILVAAQRWMLTERYATMQMSYRAEYVAGLDNEVCKQVLCLGHLFSFMLARACDTFYYVGRVDA